LSVVSDVDVTVPEESARPATNWGPIFAGGIAAAAATVVLTLVGSGLGLTAVSPFSGEGASATTLTVGAAIWLVIVQWLAALLGGYVAGRLRTKWVNVHTDEVFFRDTAHGFLAWALATLIVAVLLTTTLTAMVGAGVQAAANVTGAAAGAATQTAANQSGGSGNSATDMTGYFVDTLLRPANAANPAPAGANPDRDAAEITRMLAADAATGQMPAEDRSYLEQVVAARTGLSPADAKVRVDQVLARVDQAKQAAKDAADKARKAGATFALLGALSLVIGAFIASAAAAFGGRLRDENEGALMAR
jgi:hypothetical protein